MPAQQGMHTGTCIQSFNAEGVFSALYRPQGPVGGLLAVCMPLGDERNNIGRTVHLLLKQAAARGWTALTFDYPGMGESRGQGRSCTLDGCARAGRAVLEAVPGGPFPRRVILGIRSGAFCAADLCRSGDDLVLWHPYTAGRAFLRDLKLQAQIRGALAGGEGAGYLLNGIEINPGLKDELESRKSLCTLDQDRMQIMQIGPSVDVLPQYRAAGCKVTVVVSPPLWNAHEGWDSGPLVEATMALIEN